MKQKYLVSIFDVDWLFSQRNGAGDPFAELHFNLRGFCMKRFLDTRFVSYIEQFGYKKALLANSTNEEQASAITVYLQQRERRTLLTL